MPSTQKGTTPHIKKAHSSIELQELVKLFAKSAEISALRKLIDSKKVNAIHCEGLCASAAAVAMAALDTVGIGRQLMLYVMDDEESAGYFYNDLKALLRNERTLFLPSAYRRAAKYAQRDAANEIMRTEALEAVNALNPDDSSAACLHLVTFAAALSERVVAKEALDEHTIHLVEGNAYDLTELSEALRTQGFRATDYVYEPGEYAVRGSILDVYSYASDLPFRIDFFGDEVESIRTFEIDTQLSKERRREVGIVSAMAAEPSQGVTFTSLLPKSTCMVVNDLKTASETLQRVFAEGFSAQAIAARQAEGEANGDFDGEAARSLDKDAVFADAELVVSDLLRLQRLEIGTRTFDTPDAVVRFHSQPQPVYHKDFDLVASSFRRYIESGYTIYILADSEKQHERLRSIFDEMSQADTPIVFTAVRQTLHGGFVSEERRLCLFTDHQIFDRYHKYTLQAESTRSSKMALTLKDLREFHIGDFVVHVDHGIGRFMGLVRMPGADGSMQEVIKIVYQNDDVVYVSIHALHKVSKYKGQDGEEPRLSHLGTGAWEKMKERTKKKIKDIARDLIQLYSQRHKERGFAFSADSFMQQELEASFTYEDTPDQLRATQEVKADMESQRPMDRLVCGDVGFGKTEVAVRAAFKAAADGKQVAVLVPTTVLALQHYHTFSNRLRDFPVRVDYLSRARTPKQTRELLADLAEGKIDIVIGTHRLIGKSVKFKDLGLLIVDEEQKFGVSVKEKLRQLKVNVDTLTMSATPIPRTLQFSLMGARDFSVIQTPPPNRYPIHTEVHEFGHEVIADAINFEMSRNGQTFFVTNRISALPNLKQLIEKHVPDARVAIGHGQMPADKLEQVVIDFINHDYDVLLSTTILENGIDIPNANTIIVDAAHTFGLSDLHQMRGRVGRSNRKAFCYLLAPPMSLLKDDARRRLQAIETFSDLGSGISIAMQDLEIRGAGNLLGAEQSGFIADLGYETYQKILSQAMAELKNDEFATLYADAQSGQKQLSGEFFVDECTIESDIHAYFPETYVPGSGERMLLYRELGTLHKEADLESFSRRMTDRFGHMPHEGTELINVARLRREGRRLGVERLLLKKGRLTLYFVSNVQSPFYHSPAFGRIIDYAMQNLRRCKLDEQAGKRRMSIDHVGSAAEAVKILNSLAGL